MMVGLPFFSVLRYPFYISASFSFVAGFSVGFSSQTLASASSQAHRNLASGVFEFCDLCLMVLAVMVSQRPKLIKSLGLFFVMKFIKSRLWSLTSRRTEIQAKHPLWPPLLASRPLEAEKQQHFYKIVIAHH